MINAYMHLVVKGNSGLSVQSLLVRIFEMNESMLKFIRKLMIMKILIVDDSLMICGWLETKLSTIPQVEFIDQAHSVREAIKYVQGQAVDVVILDLIMPDGSGINVLKHLKKYTPETLVIILTNYPLPPYRNICKEIGADYFLDKSLEFERVVEILSKYEAA